MKETQPPLLPFPDEPSIAVLPFINMSNDPSQDYFSDGLTEELISHLARLPALFVISRRPAFTYKDKAVKVQEVGRELGVRYVLEGSVRRWTTQVWITAQLVSVSTGLQLWSRRYDRELKDIFALQDKIVRKIVMTLNLQLTLQKQGVLVRPSTDDMDAYDHFLRGINFCCSFNLSRETNLQARRQFEQAVALDPQYAEAYVLLGVTYVRGALHYKEGNVRVRGRALELAQKTVALDDSLAIAHQALGWAYLLNDSKEPALIEGRRAIALAPNDADCYADLASMIP